MVDPTQLTPSELEIVQMAIPKWIKKEYQLLPRMISPTMLRLWAVVHPKGRRLVGDMLEKVGVELAGKLWSGRIGIEQMLKWGDKPKVAKDGKVVNYWPKRTVSYLDPKSRRVKPPLWYRDRDMAIMEQEVSKEWWGKGFGTRYFVKHPQLEDLRNAPTWIWGGLAGDDGGSYLGRSGVEEWLGWGKMRYVDGGKLWVARRELFWLLLPYYCYWLQVKRWRLRDDEGWTRVLRGYGALNLMDRNWEELKIGRLRVGEGLTVRERVTGVEGEKQFGKGGGLEGVRLKWLEGMYSSSLAGRDERERVKIQLRLMIMRRALREEERVERENTVVVRGKDFDRYGNKDNNRGAV